MGSASSRFEKDSNLITSPVLRGRELWTVTGRSSMNSVLPGSKR